MKVRDLLEAIEKGLKNDPNFLEWAVYIQVVNGNNYEHHKSSNWKFKEDSDGWEYIECAGWNTYFTEDKIFTVNADY